MARYTLEQVRANQRYSILNGACAAVAQNIYAGFLALFAIEALHATNMQVALISSMPQLMNLLAMIPGAVLINRLAAKKDFTGKSLFAARFFLLVIALIPFLPSADHAWMLVAAVALLNLPSSLSNLSWQALIGDLIPQEERNRFFGERNRISTLAAMVSVLVVGIVLNLFDKSNPAPYQFFFFMAFLLGMAEVYYLYKHEEIPRERKEKPVDQKGAFHLGIVKEMAREKPFILFLGSAVLFNFGWQMAWPLFNIYQISYAEASAFWVSLFTVANQISQMISYPYWGKFADKYGNSTMLFVAGLGIASAPVLTVISTNLYYLTVVNLFTGISVAGVTMLLFNQLLNVSPEEDRTTYIAGYNIVIGLIGFIAPQVGVWLLEHLEMAVSMSVSAVIRLLGALAFLAVVIFFEKKKNHNESFHKVL